MGKKFILAAIMAFTVIAASAQAPSRTTIKGSTNRQTTVTQEKKQSASPEGQNRGNVRPEKKEQPKPQSRPSQPSRVEQPRPQARPQARPEQPRPQDRPGQPRPGQPRPGNHGTPPPPPPHHQSRPHAGIPPVPPRHDYNRYERMDRANMSRIVVETSFFTKEEAMDYVMDLLYDRYYEIETITSSSITTRMTRIPTGYFCSEMFSMKFNFSRNSRGIKVVISSRWRPSNIASAIYDVFFEPDYVNVTYYAWETMEDIARYLPHWAIVYQRR